MGLDSLSPVAPARIRCLLLPYGRIKRSRFLNFIERLRPEAAVRLGDISSNDGSDRNMFSPLAFPSGTVLYDFTTSVTTLSHRSLVPFELYREILAVVAVADGQEYSGGASNAEDGLKSGMPRTEELESAELNLKDIYPSAFVHRLFVFDCDVEDKLLSKGIIPIPLVSKSKVTTVRTVMCDLTSVLLAEMTTFARSVQALPNLEIPKPYKPGSSIKGASNQDNFTPGSRSPTATNSRAQSPTNDLDKHMNRTSLPAHLVSTKLANEYGRPRSAADGTRTPPITFDEMSDLPERPTSTSGADLSNRNTHDRVSTQGFGPGSVGERARNQAKSRIGVVIGSMHLLAGRWPDAIKELGESATAAKANSDYAWHAKALDYLLVTILMYAWAGLDFEIPQILYPFADRSALASMNPFHQQQSISSDHANSAIASAEKRSALLQSICSILPDLANNILHLYSRAAQFSSSPVPQIVFSDTTIRLAKILALVHNSSGALTDVGLQNIVTNVPLPADHVNPEKPVPNPSKSDVSMILHRAFPNPGIEEYIDLIDRLSILSGMASVLSSLGLHRKKAFMLREFLTTLLPSLIQTRKQSAAEQGLHPAASLSTLDIAVNEMGVSGILGRNEGMDHGIQQFLILICQVYGVVITDSGITSNTAKTLNSQERDAPSGYDDTATIAERALAYAVKRAFGNPILKLDVVRHCINVCEALPDLRGVLRFSSDLLNTAGSGIAPGPTTTDSSPSIPIEDQARLSNNISRTISAASQLGFDNLEAEYWDEFLLRNIEVVARNMSNEPIARRKAELDFAKITADKKDGPFIYNPFAKPGTAIREIILIAGEEVTFAVMLQNLFDFDLEVELIQFDVDENILDAKVTGVVIGAYRTQHVHITAIPKVEGSLKVDACIAKIKGCRARRFPLFRNPWRMKDELKIKRHGLGAATIPKERPVSVSSDARSGRQTQLALPIATKFDATVIRSQPTVVLKSTSLPQSAIMILEGERKTFSVTLQNTSGTAVDLVLLSFTDSSTEALQRNFENNDLSAAELYEAETGVLQKPALKISNETQDEDISIPEHGSLTIEIQVYGKVGLTKAALLVEYGHLGVPRSEIDEKFYTRQLTIPFSVTVGTTASLVSNDLLPFNSDFVWKNRRKKDQKLNNPNEERGSIDSIRNQRFQDLLRQVGLRDDGSQHCLVVLDFINSWSNPVTLGLKIKPVLSDAPTNKGKDHNSYCVSEILQPGILSRVLVLLPRFSVPNPFAAIPTTRNKRQFVVSASKISPDFERLSREMFWYREEVLKLMEATWIEPRSGRTGEIDLRRLVMTPRMFETLRMDEVEIDIALASYDEAKITGSEKQSDGDGAQQYSRNRYSVATSTFYKLSIILTSRLPQPMYPLLRIQPALRNQPYNIALDLNKKLAFNGVLQQSLPLLNPGETRKVQVGLVFLASGEYEFGACVEEVRVWRERKAANATKPRQRTVTGELRAEDLIRTDRRTWFAKEACGVDVGMHQKDR